MHTLRPRGIGTAYLGTDFGAGAGLPRVSGGAPPLRPVSQLPKGCTGHSPGRHPHPAVFVAGVKSTLKGLNKLIINKAAIEADLEDNWAVVAEAIQTILRREAYPNPYEALKALTRTNSKVTQASIAEFIDTLDVSAELKEQLKQISPSNYTGKL